MPGPSSVGREARATPKSCNARGDLALEVLDAGDLSLDNIYVEERLRVLALTVAAGTSQIQRNIIGERLLGAAHG